MRYRVTYEIEVSDKRDHYVTDKGETVSTFGLIQFTRDCPPTHHNANKRQAKHAEDHNYRVISCSTQPLEQVETSTGGMAYMEPALARNRHMTEGTEAEPRVTYSVPVDCLRWLDRFLERQGYEAVGDMPERTVVTRSEADALREAALEAEIAGQEES
jgi:hypothetical protein